MEFRLVSNQSEKSNYNPNLVALPETRYLLNSRNINISIEFLHLQNNKFIFMMKKINKYQFMILIREKTE